MAVLFLYGSESRCHKAPSLIVRSHAGGHVTQNCIACGYPRKLPASLVPEVVCPACGHSTAMFKDERSNYCYRCTACQKTFKLADVVPHWSQEFEYHGFRPDDHDHAERLRLIEERIRALLEKTRKT